MTTHSLKKVVWKHFATPLFESHICSTARNTTVSIVQIRLKTLVITWGLMAQIMPMNEDNRLNILASVKDSAFRVLPSGYRKSFIHTRRLKSMDTSLSPFGEDLDYALRCIRYGFTIRCVHNARLLHRWGGSYERYSDEKVTWVESHRIQSKFRNLPTWMWFVAPLSERPTIRNGIARYKSPCW